MPTIDLKEAIKVLEKMRNDAKGFFENTMESTKQLEKEIEALSLAIQKLQLFEQVEKGEVRTSLQIENILHKVFMDGQVCSNPLQKESKKTNYIGLSQPKDEILALCNANLTKKMAGMEEVLVHMGCSVARAKQYTQALQKLMEE